MSDMQPTNQLRFVKRQIPVDENTTKWVSILQQGWVSSYGGWIEWRDVPLIEE